MKQLIKIVIKNCLTVVCALLLCACSSPSITLSDSVSDARVYKNSIKSIEKKDYVRAIEHLKNLESRYPYGTFSPLGQLQLMYVYLKSGDAENAHAVAARFINLHPDYPNIDYALYMLGLSSWHASEGFFEKYLPIDVTERDISEQFRSFYEFSELLSRFPDSQYAADARQRMVAIRERIATQKLHIANFYLNRGAYIAAINRANEIISHYEKTSQVEYALGILVLGYHKLGLKMRVNGILKILKMNFPDSKFIKDDYTNEYAFNELKKLVMKPRNSVALSNHVAPPPYQNKRHEIK